MRDKNRLSPLAVKLVTFVIVIVAWEIAGQYINPLFLSSPSAIFFAFIELMRSGELISALLSSLSAFLIGMALAIAVGTTIGVIMGRVRMAELILDPYVTALYSTPSIALIPLFILWFGVGLTAKVFIIFFLSIFIIIINTFTGVKNLSQSVIDVGAAFGANERQSFWMIVLPAALPFIMTGLRLAVGRGILAMIVAEFFTSISGLGGMIVKYGNFFQTAKMFVPIIVVSLLGVCAVEILKYVERKLAPWKETERAASL
jgi:ABC-type nitrate/sulfonate/bicarbonate transport system permease component